jgi:hypothetical protein
VTGPVLHAPDQNHRIQTDHRTPALPSVFAPNLPHVFDRINLVPTALGRRG